MSVCIVRSDEDSSSCRLSDSTATLTICSQIPQNQYWSTLVQNLELLLENNIPEHEFEVRKNKKNNKHKFFF